MNKTYSLLAMLIIVLLVCVAIIPVLADYPFRETVTSTAGSATYTYDAGVNNGAYSAFQVQAIILGGEASTTTTVSMVSGTLTNSIGSKVIAAGDGNFIVASSNLYWGFLDDKLLITSGDTNTFSLYIIGVEK